jgi:hypothetical protein
MEESVWNTFGVKFFLGSLGIAASCCSCNTKEVRCSNLNEKKSTLYTVGLCYDTDYDYNDNDYDISTYYDAGNDSLLTSWLSRLMASYKYCKYKEARS